ncbi:hypothetical protein ACLX1H_001244 [Fusarium chlamydosporum]
MSTEPLFPIVSGRYRMATTSLRRLPLVNSPDKVLSGSAQNAMLLIRHRAIETVKSLKLAGDEEYYVDIDVYQTKDCPESAAPTALIVFENFPRNREALEQATRDIAKFAYEQLKGSSAEPYRVEMIGERLVHAITYGPVRGRGDLEACWEAIKTLVYGQLQGDPVTKDHMTSVSLFHYGLDEDYTKNPTTIFITLDYDCPEVEWPRVIRRIEEDLANNHFPVLYIHMEHNIGFCCASPPFEMVYPTGNDRQIIGEAARSNAFIQGDYNTTVSLGDAIGPAKYIENNEGSKRYPGHGTLGCYVEIKTAASPNWEKYALTNYHVIRATLNGFQMGSRKGPLPPVNRCDLRRADEFGLPPGGHGQLASIESPPRAKHSYTIWKARRDIDDRKSEQQMLLKDVEDNMHAVALSARLDNEIARLKTDIDKKVDFFDHRQNTMGEIYAASGFTRKTPENGRLDWALIKVSKTRTGTNRLPDAEAWRKAPALPAPFLTFGTQLQPQRQSISKKHENRCTTGFKYGAASGATYGEYHEFKTNVNLLDDRHLGPTISSEYVFQRASGNSALKGDSGSVIYDNLGCIVGLLFRGLQPSNDRGNGHVYVTPIEYVFDHIKEFSKGRITDIRIAQA